MPPERISGKTIQSVEVSCDILEELQQSGGSTIMELSEEVDLTPGAIHTHLATLKQYGYVEQENTTYSLGPGCLLLGASVRNNSDLTNAAKGQVDKLAHETGEIGRIVIEHRGKLIVLHEKFGSDAIGRSFHLQNRAKAQRHIHCTAAGKAIFAYLAADRRDQLLEENFPKLTANTLTDPERLREELTTIRERGYAFSDEEQLTGIRGVGAPILTKEDEVIGAISVSGPSSRIKGDTFREDLVERIVHAANVSQVNLQTDTAEL